MNLKTLIDKNLRSHVDHYIIHGLTSSLVDGKLRYFHMTEPQTNLITPHSHRFDFVCFVLKGRVRNRFWHLAQTGTRRAVATLTYNEMGDYGVDIDPTPRIYECVTKTHNAGDWYGMAANQIHDIMFDRDTEVLFFEGASVSNTSVALFPFDANDEPINTLRSEPWMFAR